MLVGKELVHVLLKLAPLVPEYDVIWKAITSSTTGSDGSTRAPAMLQLVATPTPKHITVARVTCEMEKELMFVFQRVKMGQQKRYQMWFAERFLPGPDSDTLIPCLVRFICCNWHPTNQILCSDIVTRWAILGWLLKSVHSEAALVAARMALFFDWFWFDPKTSNIMNIEPAILLMYCSAEQYPDVTAMLMSFIVRAPYTFPENVREPVFWGIHHSFMAALQKRVIPSLEILTSFSHVDPKTRARFKELINGPRKPQQQQQPEPEHANSQTAPQQEIKTERRTVPQENSSEKPQESRIPILPLGPEGVQPVPPKTTNPTLPQQTQSVPVQQQQQQQPQKPKEEQQEQERPQPQQQEQEQTAKTTTLPTTAPTATTGTQKTTKNSPEEVPLATAIVSYGAKPCCKTLAQLLLSLGDSEKEIPGVINVISVVVAGDLTDLRTSSVVFAYGTLQALFHLYKTSVKHRRVSVAILCGLARRCAAVRYRLLTFLASTVPGGLVLGKALKGFSFPGKGMAWAASAKEPVTIANRNVPLTGDDAELLFENALGEPGAGFAAARHFQPYFDLVAALGEPGAEEEEGARAAVLADCRLCAEQCPAVYALVYPVLLRWLPAHARGSAELAQLAVHAATPRQHCALAAALATQDLAMLGGAGGDVAAALAAAGRGLHYHEQVWLWELYAAEARNPHGGAARTAEAEALLEALFASTRASRPDAFDEREHEQGARMKPAFVAGVRALLVGVAAPSERLAQSVLCPAAPDLVPVATAALTRWLAGAGAGTVAQAAARLAGRALAPAQQAGLRAVLRALCERCPGARAPTQQLLRAPPVRRALEQHLAKADLAALLPAPAPSDTPAGPTEAPRKRSRLVIDDDSDDDNGSESSSGTGSGGSSGGGGGPS